MPLIKKKEKWHDLVKKKKKKKKKKNAPKKCGKWRSLLGKREFKSYS